MLLSFFSAGAIAFGLVLGAVVAAPDVDGGASFTRVSAEPGVFLLPSMSPPRWSWPGEPAPGVLPGALGVWALATAMPAIRAPAAAMVINFLMGISSVLVQRKGVLIFNRTTFASPVYNREPAGLFPRALDCVFGHGKYCHIGQFAKCSGSRKFFWRVCGHRALCSSGKAASSGGKSWRFCRP